MRLLLTTPFMVTGLDVRVDASGEIAALAAELWYLLQLLQARRRYVEMRPCDQSPGECKMCFGLGVPFY